MTEKAQNKKKNTTNTPVTAFVTSNIPSRWPGDNIVTLV